MNTETLRWLFAAHAFVTLFMTGLIWFVQVVHYPLFGKIGKMDFAEYEAQHTRRTGRLVSGPMLLELGLAAALVWATSGTAAWCGLGLLGIIWLSTALGQVPMHRRLEKGFDNEAHRQLVVGNWVRTIGWSLRGVLAIVMHAST